MQMNKQTREKEHTTTNSFLIRNESVAIVLFHIMVSYAFDFDVVEICATAQNEQNINLML